MHPAAPKFRIKRAIVLCLLAAPVIGLARRVYSDDEITDVPTPVINEEQPMSVWMKKKLEYSKDILEDLTEQRFDRLEKRAEQMRVIGKIEGFVRGGSPVYRAHAQVFDLATRELKRQAEAKDINGATLAFHQLTTSCVACHQSLRDESAAAE